MAPSNATTRIKQKVNTFFDRLREFPFILRPLWFIVLFQLLVLVVYWFMPQGQDLLLAIMEDVAEWELMTFFWFILAIAFWSITSEFGSRFILYLADISSYNLTVKQIHARKYVLKLVSKSVLFLPIITASGGFLIAYFTHFNQEISTKGFFVVSLSLGVLAVLLYHVYFGVLRERWYVLYNDGKKPVSARLRHRVQISYFAKLYSIFSHRKVTRIEALRIAAFMGVEDEKADEYANDLVTNGFTPTMKFYRPLFVRFAVFISISVVSILMFSFMYVGWYYLVGALALLTLAFASWFTVYYALELIDRLKPFGLKFSYKLVIIVWLVFVSCFNDDHPIRKSETTTTSLNKDVYSLNRQFENWVKNSDIDTAKSFPIVLIAAEGGALRTGCFTSMMLAQIQDAYPAFKKSIFCYSSVSGGTLGVAVFNGLNAVKYERPYGEAMKQFYNQDFLAPVVGKMAFGEVLGLLYPSYVQFFDRASALEQAWEIGWDETDLGDHPNFLRQAFHTLPDLQKPGPVHFINTTEVESGYRAVLSNVRIDTGTFIKTIDIFQKLKYPINYSTAVSLSARFPLISPAASIEHSCTQSYHYVDGGYFENKGAATLREALNAIRVSPLSKNAKVFVIQFNFGMDKLGDEKDISMFSQIREIINGIYNVRAGHTEYSKELLKRDTRSHGGVFISLDLQPDVRKVPLNWTLSRRAVNRVFDFCQEELKQYEDEHPRHNTNPEMKKLLIELQALNKR
ncbi:MAG TPA: hypothetical protein VFZ52_12985 [Chryseolinea sp.]